MSDEQIRNHADHGSYEHEDLSPSGVIYFMVGLAVVVVVIYFIVFGMYRFLDTYEKAHQPAMSPMVTPQADTRAVTHDDTQAFPQPRLEENERTQLRQIIEDEDSKLATYSWVDKEKGVAQIPIDRAMDLLVQRGLPVRSEKDRSETRAENTRPENSGSEGSTPAQTSAPAKKQSPKATAGKAAASGN
jgi:hypothetical protein